MLPAPGEFVVVRRRPLRALATAVLPVALAAVAAVLPAGTALAADEHPAGNTVVGQLVQAWPEPAAAEHGSAGHHRGHAHREPLTWIEPLRGAPVPVAAEDVEDVPVGATIQATVGGAASGAAAEERDGSTVDVLDTTLVEEPEVPSVPAPSRAGLTNEVTVVLVAPPGAEPDGTTVDEVVDAVDGPVARFWSEQSDGAISVGATGRHGWLDTTVGCAEPALLWQEVAETVAFTPGPGRHLMLYVSSSAGSDCSYALGEMGTGPAAGGRFYVRDVVPSLIAHELGHNFGLGHSSGSQCDAEVEGSTCRNAPYRDFYDVMGFSWSQVGSLNVAQAARLGVLPASAQQRVPAGSAAGSHTLSPLSGRAGIRALRLTDADGVDYWLEYRTPTGRDAWLDTEGNGYDLQSGVLLRRAGALPDTSLLLDPTPAAVQGWDADRQAALPVGAPVQVSGGDFSVTVRSVSPAGATVEVVPTPAGAVAPAPVAVPADVPPAGPMPGRGCGANCSAPSSGGTAAVGDPAPAPVAPVAAPVAELPASAPAAFSPAAAQGGTPSGGPGLATVAAVAGVLGAGGLLAGRAVVARRRAG